MIRSAAALRFPSQSRPSSNHRCLSFRQVSRYVLVATDLAILRKILRKFCFGDLSRARRCNCKPSKHGSRLPAASGSTSIRLTRPKYSPTRGFYERHGFRCEARLVDFYAPPTIASSTQMRQPASRLVGYTALCRCARHRARAGIVVRVSFASQLIKPKTRHAKNAGSKTRSYRRRFNLQ